MKKETTSTRKFRRSYKGAIISGVSRGIANYFNIDVIIPRLLFLISVLFGGTGVLIYILLRLLIPADNSKLESNLSLQRMLKLALIIIGIVCILVFILDFNSK